MVNVVITNAGINEAVSQNNQGFDLVINSFRLGSGVGYVPSKDEVALRGSIVHTGGFSSIIKQDFETVEFTISLDKTIGTFTFGEIGLYTQAGTLFAIITLPNPFEKRANTTTSLGNEFINHIPIKFTAGLSDVNVVLNNVGTTFAEALVVSSPELMPVTTAAASNLYVMHYGTKKTMAYIGTDNIWNFTNYSDVGSVVVSSLAGTNPKTMDVTSNTAIPTNGSAGEIMLQVSTGGNQSKLIPVTTVQQINGTSYRITYSGAFDPAVFENLQFLYHKDASDRVFDVITTTYDIQLGKLSYVLPLAADKNSLTVNIDGIIQQRSSYNVVGTSLIFTEQPPHESTLEVLIQSPYHVISVDGDKFSFRDYKHKTLAGLVSNSALNYGNGPDGMLAGDIMSLPSVNYEVVSSTSTTNQYETIGGVKFNEAGPIFTTIATAQAGNTHNSSYIIVAGQLYELHTGTTPDLTTGDGVKWQAAFGPAAVVRFSKARTASNAAALAALLQDGETAEMGGLTYMKDSTSPVSATHDLGVDHLIPAGTVASIHHFGIPFAPSVGSEHKNRAVTWMNNTNGTLIIPKGSYNVDGVTYNLPSTFKWTRGGYVDAVNIFSEALKSNELLMTETDTNTTYDDKLRRYNIKAKSRARGGQRSNSIHAELDNFSNNSQGNNAVFASALSANASVAWTAGIHSELKHLAGIGVGLNVEVDSFSANGSIFGVVISNITNGNNNAHPITGDPKTDHLSSIGIAIDGDQANGDKGAWQTGMRFNDGALKPTGVGILFEGAATKHIHFNSASTEADIVHSADSAYGSIYEGNFGTAALRINDNQWLAMSTAGTIKMRFNSTGQRLEFINGTDLVHSIDVTANVNRRVGLFGAVGDGSTDDTFAFQAAINALPVLGGIIILENEKNYFVNIGSLTLSNRKILWLGDNAKVNGLTDWGLPGQQKSYSSTVGRAITNIKGSNNDGSYSLTKRDADYIGGVATEIDYAERWENTVGVNVGSASEAKVEKVGQFDVVQKSLYAKAVALASSAKAETTGHALGIESVVMSEQTPTKAHQAAQFSINATGADTNGLRRIAEIVTHGPAGETTAYDSQHVTNVGLLVGAGSADMEHGIRFVDHATKGKITKKAISIEGAGLEYGIDMSSGTFSQAGIRLKTDVPLQFDTGGTYGVMYNLTTNRVQLTNSGTEGVGFSINGSSSSIHINGDKVLGAQLPAIADVAAAPTQAEHNAVLQVLRDHGLIAT